MKKDKTKGDEPRPEYDFSGGVRGKHFRTPIQNFIVVDPDVLAVFPTSEAVNEALRTLIRIQRSVPQPEPPANRRRRATV